MRIRPILLTVLLASAAPVLAVEPAAPPEPAPVARDAAPAAGADERVVDRHCLKETGTRIRPRGDRRHCSAFAGRVWSREDLDRTGRIDIADALRTLDVSIR